MDTQQFPFPNPILPGQVWLKDADYTVPVFSQVGVGPKGDKGDMTGFDDLTEAQKEEIYRNVSAVGNKVYNSWYTTSAGSTVTVPIGVPDFSQAFDMLFVDVNGLDLTEGLDYTISGTDIILTDPITQAGQEIHFKVIRYELADGDKVIENVMGRKDYNTVAEMQADKDLKSGDICHTLGFHEPGDGGAAWYKIKAHGVPNGMDIIDCHDSVIAELQITEDYVTPEMFGAYGDGVHDDTNAIHQSFMYNNIVFLNKIYLITTIHYLLNHDISLSGIGLPEIKATVQSQELICFSPTEDYLTISLNGIKFNANEKSAVCVWIRHEADNADENYNLSIFVDKCVFVNPKNYQSNKGSSCIGIRSGIKKCVISNCYFDNCIKTVANLSTINSTFISVITMNENSFTEINNNYFGSFVNQSDNYKDFDCIHFNAPNTMNAIASVHDNVFTHTFCRFMKIVGPFTNIYNNTFESDSDYVEMIFDCQEKRTAHFINNVVKLTSNNYQNLHVSNLFAFYPDDSNISIFENNYVYISLPLYILISLQGSNSIDGYDVRIINNNIIYDNNKTGASFFRTDKVFNVDNFVTIENNIIKSGTDSFSLVYFGNYASADNKAVVRIVNNINKSNDRISLIVNGIDTQRLWIDGNEWFKSQLSIQNLDFKKRSCLHLPYYWKVLNTPTNIPTILSSATFKYAYLEVITNDSENIIKYAEKDNSNPASFILCTTPIS